MRAKLLTLLLVLLSLVLTACGGAERDDTGTITGGGDVDVFALSVGDCFSTDATDEVGSVEGVPCDEPHDSEVYALVDYDAGPDAEWPGQEAIDEFSDEACVAEFEEFIGLSYDQSIYYISYLQPTEESWAQDDREVVCLVGAESGQVTGTLRGIGE